MSTTTEDMELPLNMSEDENCTFVTANYLEQTENFDEWLDKNGVKYIITNECLNDIMIHNQLDPLLNQINGNDTLESLSDGEANFVGEPYEDTDTNEETGVKMNKDEFVFKTLSCKCDYLKEKFPGGIQVMFQVKENKVRLTLSDNENKSIPFPSIYIIMRETGGQIAIPKGNVPVSQVEKVSLADDLHAHMPSLHLSSGSRLYICPKPDCDEAFTRLSAARLHALVQIGHKPFKCSYPGCTWAFFNSFKLRRHQDSHTNQKDFICCVKNCGRKFTNIYNLNIHIKNHGRPATLPCPVKGCTMMFQTSRIREKHFKTHDISEAPYPCPITSCSRAFFLITGLTAHSKTHSHKESELRCDYPNCGKVFEQPCRLKEHSRMHTGQRPYLCTYDQCKWRFTSASKLKRHQSTHTKERKFHCTIGTCTKSFLRSEHLKEHTLTHIGQRSFQCEVCGANFFGKSALYLHIKKTHPEKSQVCARAIPYTQPPQKPTAEMLLEQAIQSLGVPSDIILGSGLLPEEPLELLDNENFSTVNLRDLD